MTWDELLQRYDSAWRNSEERDGSARAAAQVVIEAQSRLAVAGETDTAWLRGALEDDRRKWFVAAVTRDAPMIPAALFAPLLRAAVYERDPSANRQFVAPCIRAFGKRVVNESLLRILETGSNFERVGAANALYWASESLSFPPGTHSFDIEHATPESRRAYEELADVWERRRSAFLTEFVSNCDVEVRQSLISHLSFDPAAYPDEMRPLVDQALQIARGHTDPYIRQRLRVQLGEESLLPALPHRKKPWWRFWG